MIINFLIIIQGKMEGACIEAEVGSDSIKVNIEEINPAIKEKLKTIVWRCGQKKVKETYSG